MQQLPGKIFSRFKRIDSAIGTIPERKCVAKGYKELPKKKCDDGGANVFQNKKLPQQILQKRK